jgi:hypothetical protein
MTSPRNSGDHLTDLELAAYLDRGLSTTDKTVVEDHLATCVDCRRHLVESRSFLDKAGRPRRIIAVSATLAAAVAAFLVINTNGLWRGPESSPVTRSQATGDAVTAYGPVGDITPSHLRFVWAPARSATTYRLTLTGDDGSTLWSTSTADTAIALPDSVRLVADKRYYWITDALTSDGIPLSTGLREFKISR